VSRGEVADARL